LRAYDVTSLLMLLIRDQWSSRSRFDKTEKKTLQG
jgi:hypothetical protein